MTFRSVFTATQRQAKQVLLLLQLSWTLASYLGIGEAHKDTHTLLRVTAVHWSSTVASAHCE